MGAPNLIAGPQNRAYERGSNATRSRPPSDFLWTPALRGFDIEIEPTAALGEYEDRARPIDPRMLSDRALMLQGVEGFTNYGIGTWYKGGHKPSGLEMVMGYVHGHPLMRVAFPFEHSPFDLSFLANGEVRYARLIKFTSSSNQGSGFDREQVADREASFYDCIDVVLARPMAREVYRFLRRTIKSVEASRN